MPRALEVAVVSVYVAGLLAMLVLSATYNLWPVSRAKWVLRRFDHSAIYVLIAATYTPFIMEMKDSIFAVALLIGVWCVAIVGIVLKLSCPAVSTGSRSAFIWRWAGAASCSMTPWWRRCRPWRCGSWSPAARCTVLA